MSSFIREPPQKIKDPGCRIMEPSDLQCPEDYNSNIQIKQMNLLRIPPKVKSYEEPVKKIQINDPNIRNCMNCEGRFRLKTMRLGGKLCANCFKIHESVSRTV